MGKMRDFVIDFVPIIVGYSHAFDALIDAKLWFAKHPEIKDAEELKKTIEVAVTEFGDLGRK